MALTYGLLPRALTNTCADWKRVDILDPEWHFVSCRERTYAGNMRLVMQIEVIGNTVWCNRELKVMSVTLDNLWNMEYTSVNGIVRGTFSKWVRHIDGVVHSVRLASYTAEAQLSMMLAPDPTISALQWSFFTAIHTAMCAFFRKNPQWPLEIMARSRSAAAAAGPPRV